MNDELVKLLLQYISPDDIKTIIASSGDVEGALKSAFGDDYATSHKSAYDKAHGKKDAEDESADFKEGYNDGKDMSYLEPDDDLVAEIFDSTINSDYCRGFKKGYTEGAEKEAHKITEALNKDPFDGALEFGRKVSDERCKEILSKYDGCSEEAEMKELVDSLTDDEYAALYKELTPEDIVATVSPEALEKLKELMPHESTEHDTDTNALAKLIGSMKL